jgi:hypothetical protein
MRRRQHVHVRPKRILCDIHGGVHTAVTYLAVLFEKDAVVKAPAALGAEEMVRVPHAAQRVDAVPVDRAVAVCAPRTKERIVVRGTIRPALCHIRLVAGYMYTRCFERRKGLAGSCGWARHPPVYSCTIHHSRPCLEGGAPWGHTYLVVKDLLACQTLAALCAGEAGRMPRLAQGKERALVPFRHLFLAPACRVWMRLVNCAACSLHTASTCTPGQGRVRA